jgi:hypothetical protein
MAIVLLIPMRSDSPPDRVARAEDARDLGGGELVQEAAAHGATVGRGRRLGLGWPRAGGRRRAEREAELPRHGMIGA